jgi:hypothetical protein
MLPWRRFAIDTGWSPAEVERELGSFLERPPTPDSAWRGTQSPHGFRIALEGRPVARRTVILSGLVQPTPTGARVMVTARPSAPAMLFLFVAIPLLTILSLAVSVAAILRREVVVLFIWTAPFALWSGIVRPFLSEAAKAEATLRKFFPPPPPPEMGPFR